MANVPQKIVLKSTTKISLNDRFSNIQKEARGTVQNVRAKMIAENEASSKNRRLAQQMANRPTVQAALKIKKKSLQQRLGKGNVKARLNLPQMAPPGVMGRGQGRRPWRRRGGGPITEVRGRGRGAMRGAMRGSRGGRGAAGGFGSPGAGAGRGGGGRGAGFQRGRGVRGRGFMGQRGGIRGRSGGDGDRPPFMRGNNRGRWRGGFDERYRGRASRGAMRMRGRGGRGGRGIRGNRGGNRGGGQQPSREQLDNQLEEYMSKTKYQLDNELDSYMAQTVE